MVLTEHGFKLECTNDSEKKSFEEKMAAVDVKLKTDPGPWCATTYRFGCHVDALTPRVRRFCRGLLYLIGVTKAHRGKVNLRIVCYELVGS